MADKKNQKQVKVKTIRGTDYLIDFRGEPLGAGSYGYVRRAYNMKNPKKKLVCKIMSLQSFQHLESAKNEVRIATKLPKNPNLVNYEKARFNTKYEWYLFMEFCNGGTLENYISQQTSYLSEKEIFDFLNQFINGYRELHKLKILHRDLKPDNILIHNGQFKITDFGLSKWLEFDNQHVSEKGKLKQNIYTYAFQRVLISVNQIKSTQKKGNLLTRAPEIYPEELRDERYSQLNDFSKIDMFSLGVILYNMAYSYDDQPSNKQGSKRNSDCHPFIGKLHSQDVKIFCKLVNNKDEVVIPSYPHRSTQLTSLITKLCDKNVETRMDFNELLQNYFSYTDLPFLDTDLEGKSVLKTEFNQMSVLQFNNRASCRESIFPQPGMEDSLILFFIKPWAIETDDEQQKPISLNDQGDNLARDLRNQLGFTGKEGKSRDHSDDEFDEKEDSLDNLKESSQKLIMEHSEEDILLKLDEMEEELKRLDESNALVFAIFDKCIYYREIIFFIDKVQLHIDTLVKQITKNLSSMINPIDLGFIINKLVHLRSSCISETVERSQGIYSLLNKKYTQQEMEKFMESQEFVNFEALRCQDEKAIFQNSQSMNQANSISLEPNQALECLKDFCKIYDSFCDLDKKNNGSLGRHALVTYWYIYQLNRLLNEKSDFQNEFFEKNYKKFMQYYEAIDHYISTEKLYDKMIGALVFLNINVIVNCDD